MLVFNGSRCVAPVTCWSVSGFSGTGIGRNDEFNVCVSIRNGGVNADVWFCAFTNVAQNKRSVGAMIEIFEIIGFLASAPASVLSFHFGDANRKTTIHHDDFAGC